METSVASVKLFNNKYHSLTGQGWSTILVHTRKIKGNTTAAMAVWKSCLKVNSLFDFFYLDHGFVKRYRNYKFSVVQGNAKSETAKISVRCMGKVKTCLSVISSIPAPCCSSSSLSSFLTTVFCVFGSISRGCLARQRLNLRHMIRNF